MNPDKTYHIYTRANGDEGLFKIPENFRYFLKRYHDFITPIADTYAYCLMPNHVHFLLRIKTQSEIVKLSTDQTSKVFKNLGGLSLESVNESNQKFSKFLSQQFSNLFNAYSKAFNKMYSRKGSLFAPNFKRKEITSQEYFKNVVIYIHQNPIRHGFAEKLTDWPWTSYQAILVDLPTHLKRKEILELFSNSIEYIHLHNHPIPKEIMAKIGA